MVKNKPGNSQPLKLASVLRNYDFLGSIDPSLIKGFSLYLNTPPFGYRDCKEDFIPIHLFNAVRSTLHNMFLDLGFDVSSRLPYFHKVHIYSQGDYENLRKIMKLGGRVRGHYSSTYSRIFMNGEYNGKKRSSPSLLRSLSHEMIHAVGYKKVFISKNKRSFYVNQCGFKTPESDKAFLTEALVDMLVLKLIKSYWTKNNHLKPYAHVAFYEIPYEFDVMLMDAVFEQLEMESGRTYLSIFSMMVTDFLLGSTNWSNFTKGHLKEKSIKYILRLKNINSVKRMLLVAKKLDLTNFLFKWGQADNGKNYIYCLKLLRGGGNYGY